MRIVAWTLAVAALALAAPAEAKWVASWTAAPHAPLGTTGPFGAADYNNVTLSQVVRITQGGERLRVRFSNRYGPHPLRIGAARVFRIDA
ncbi:MAG: SGNH/GDSL hydrolase family protein, partial [Porphyrobacter sp.]|nr:SGNH/GDSL hydrolase family protein [Porphyrobacter sp.]